MSLRAAHREGFVEQRVVELVRVRVGVRFTWGSG